MRVLALIPARGGSKRLPGKNIKPLGGKPLIAWSIEFALGQAEIDDVVVSTDTREIAKVARQFGADVPWMRPTELASDTATSVEVVQHALSAQAALGHQYDYLVLLQPTTPLRDPAMFREALTRCHQAAGAPVLAFADAHPHPGWCFRYDHAGRLVRYVDLDPGITRSQDLPPAFAISGSLYVIGVARFLAEPGFTGADMQGVFSTNRRYDIDIDDEIDWLVAEALIRQPVRASAP